MNEVLSRIVAGLLKSKGGEEFSSEIHRLRDEIKKITEGENTIFGKFRGLMESFGEIIPEEKQRYNAAIKALSTTSKLSRQEIVKAVNNQLEELKILEKGLLPALPGWREEFKIMETKSQEMKKEISKLREKIVQLEIEEKVMLNEMADREKQMGLVEKAVKDLFADIGTEITSIRKKVEEFTTENPALQPVPQPVAVTAKAEISAAHPIESVQTDRAGKNKEDGQESGSEVQLSYTPPDTEWQKQCPMCGGRMDFLIDGKIWMCYTCAYDEPGQQNDVQAKAGEKNNRENAPEPPYPADSHKSNIPVVKTEGSGRESEISEPSAPQDTKWQKKCPMCAGRMDFLIDGKIWMCYTCAYEESGEGVASTTGGGFPVSEPAPPLTDPWASRNFNEDQEAAMKGSIEGFSSSSNKQQPPKKKNCPACGKKMAWHETEKAWKCPFCEYERRI